MKALGPSMGCGEHLRRRALQPLDRRCVQHISVGGQNVEEFYQGCPRAEERAPLGPQRRFEPAEEVHNESPRLVQLPVVSSGCASLQLSATHQQALVQCMCYVFSQPRRETSTNKSPHTTPGQTQMGFLPTLPSDEQPHIQVILSVTNGRTSKPG